MADSIFSYRVKRRIWRREGNDETVIGETIKELKKTAYEREGVIYIGLMDQTVHYAHHRYCQLLVIFLRRYK